MTVAQAVAVRAQIKSPFLEGLAPAEVNAVLAGARYTRFPAGTVVCSQGTPADRMFLIVRGRARYFVLTPEGKKILLFWLPEGEIFGGMAMHHHPYNYIVSTETIRDSTVLVWERPTIRRLAMRYPRLLDNGLILAAEYLTFCVAAHIALTCQTAAERVAAVLTNLGRGIGRVVPNGIELEVSNEELAQAANVTHFTASRLINQWQRQGALIKTRGKILLRSPEKLIVTQNESE